MKIKYKACGHFDIETEIEIPYNEVADDAMVLLEVVRDLEDRYNLMIDIKREENE